jgi:hypothetical protein
MLQNKRNSKKQIGLKKTQMEGTEGVHLYCPSPSHRRGEEARREVKGKKNLKKKPKKQDNIVDDKTCYALKKRHHTKGHHTRPHSCY